MNLIGRNLIDAYIKKHPEAQVPLLLWLRDFIYSQFEATFLWQQDAESIIAKGCAILERHEYAVRYKINYPAKAVCISWLGNEDAFNEIQQAEMKETENQAAVSGESLITAEISFTAPRPVLKKSKQPTIAVKDAWNPVDEQVIQNFNHIEGRREESTILSEQAYKAALRTTIGNFEAAPGSPAFEELISLLPIISNYEVWKLGLPPLRSFEIVAHRIKMFDMEESYLASIAGGKTKLDNFLAGKQRLPHRVLSRLYKVLGIRLPVSEEYLYQPLSENKH